jgi:hypothetical protein
MAWSDSVAKVNASKLAKFGVAITYTLNPGAIDTPATAIRQTRKKEEVGAFPQWEEIEIDPGALPGYPAKGDWVTLDNGLQYTVTAVRRPDSYSLTMLTLNQRAGQTLP